MKCRAFVRTGTNEVPLWRMLVSVEIQFASSSSRMSLEALILRQKADVPRRLCIIYHPLYPLGLKREEDRSTKLTFRR